MPTVPICKDCKFMSSQINGDRCMWPTKLPFRNLDHKTPSPTWCPLKRRIKMVEIKNETILSCYMIVAGSPDTYLRVSKIIYAEPNETREKIFDRINTVSKALRSKGISFHVDLIVGKYKIINDQKVLVEEE